ncbi:hypothetical protein [Streptomyces sp. 8L]|uniref:hypothetical protein n=1 Tax=Streptomyces sp. 8L TaxID=2877242 RepID=UPI001CD688C7|nr:hypothetical protein [Streptomyces sp. 8L]MCA1221890.1 hypothetical protein [Streptomyces sp. 8L]
MVDLSSFVPAEFDLYEFDDSNGAMKQSMAQRRWFSQWDGLIGAPAEEVALGWSAGDSVVIVCTSGRWYDRAEARTRAAHLALGGNALPIPDRPQGPLATNQAISAIGNSDELWTGTADTRALLGGTAETAAPNGFSIGYQRIRDGFAFIVSVGIDPAKFKIRKVQDWSVYDIDARSSFPLSVLNR